MVEKYHGLTFPVKRLHLYNKKSMAPDKQQTHCYNIYTLTHDPQATALSPSKWLLHGNLLDLYKVSREVKAPHPSTIFFSELAYKQLDKDQLIGYPFFSHSIADSI